MKKFPNLTIQITLALSAASALIYEVVATNVLFGYFIESSYSIATVLGVFMTGLAIGSYLTYRTLKHLQRKKLAFGIIQTIIAIYSFFVLANLNDIVPKISTLGIFLASTSILLIPTIFLGIVFPLAGSIFEKKGKDIIGLVYASDLIGAIFGSFLAGFLLIPQLGNSATCLVGVTLNYLSALIIIPKKYKIIPIFFLLIILGLWNSPNSSLEKLYFNKMYYKNEEVFSKNSIFGEVKAFKEKNGTVMLKINNRPQCSYSYSDNQQDSQIVSSSMNLLEIKNPKVLNIGLGCGITLNKILQITKLPIDVIEINPTVIDATKEFSHVLENKKVNLTNKDGLDYLKQSVKKYDLIIFTPDNPLVAHSSPLYTVESFDLAKQHLNKEGIFTIFKIIEQSDYLDILYYSLRENFPYVYSNESSLVASLYPLAGKLYQPQMPKIINTLDKNTLAPVAEKILK